MEIAKTHLFGKRGPGWVFRCGYPYVVWCVGVCSWSYTGWRYDDLRHKSLTLRWHYQDQRPTGEITCLQLISELESMCTISTKDYVSFVSRFGASESRISFWSGVIDW